jgi:malonate-semialdehyde dehydrogenase (acetylating)/methylmalonate-semialdehyde dehydrogenase
MSNFKKQKVSEVVTCDNLIAGKRTPPQGGKYLNVESATTGAHIGNVALSTAADVDAAVAAAQAAGPAWRSLTMKSRAAIMFKLHMLLKDHADELAEIIMLENGKNSTEAGGDVAKGNETVEWATSMPQSCQGKRLEVSRGVTCEDHRDPVGIVACVVPFNFPLMVPMWTTPIALTCGNCVILKPSEKVPLTMNRVADLVAEAGVPPGVFQMIHGQVEPVTALCDHPGVDAVTFVGSSKVAQIVSRRCRALDKRCLALGGAKNHLVILPDCDPAMAAQDILVSFAGSAGQRCMAASVLVTVGDCSPVLAKLVEMAKSVKPGQGKAEVGPVIDAASHANIMKYLKEAEDGGAEFLVDGRHWAEEHKNGSWCGPTIVKHTNKADRLLHDEIFGPVLSIISVDTHDEALAIENGSPYGNAACIYTSCGAHAEYFTKRFRAGMLGVNVGVPVPREPFSFGGMYGTLSKYGDMDITGDGCVEFMTTRRKVTTKWARPAAVAYQPVDKANFDGAI